VRADSLSWCCCRWCGPRSLARSLSVSPSLARARPLSSLVGVCVPEAARPAPGLRKEALERAARAGSSGQLERQLEQALEQAEAGGTARLASLRSRCVAPRQARWGAQAPR
jgi:hypothetical protein